MATASITNGNGAPRRSPTQPGCRMRLRRWVSERTAGSATCCLWRVCLGLVLIIGAFIDARQFYPLVPVRLRLRPRHRPRRALLGADSPCIGCWLVGGPAPRVSRTSLARSSRLRCSSSRSSSASSRATCMRGTASSMAQEPSEEHLKHVWHIKGLYFATPFFLARLAVYFGVWIGYSVAMRNWSSRSRIPWAARHCAKKMHWWAPSGLAPARLDLHVLRLRRADEPAIHLVQHDLRRSVLGRRHSRFDGDLRSDRARAPLRGLPAKHDHDGAPARCRQADVRLHDLLGLHRLRPILPDLVRQHARGDAVLSPPPQRHVVSGIQSSCRSFISSCRSSCSCRERTSATRNGSRPSVHCHSAHARLRPLLANDAGRCIRTRSTSTGWTSPRRSACSAWCLCR